MAENSRTKYALVGTGQRAMGMFTTPIASRYRDQAELVGICDTNPGRLELHNTILKEELGYHEVPAFLADDFDRMIEQTRPDCVIVATVDRFHDFYANRAMEMGCDAITEKPMTISAAKCRAILETVKRTGKNLRVTFNYRWRPGTTLVKQLLGEGVIGEIVHVDMEYLLNTSHGADYFRRWHREKEMSGGLLIHKASHHFDLVNWWIDAVPEVVFGMGRLAFYGRENAESRGIEVSYDHYTGNDTSDDPFALDLSTDEKLSRLYIEPEKHDGYRRDRNVFGDNITIEDTMSALVRYRTGAVLNYSLNAYLPREGYTVMFNGTKGRLEYHEAEASHIVPGRAVAVAGEEVTWRSRLIVHPLFSPAYEVDIPAAVGGHGGGDPLLQEQIFSPDAPEDPWGRSAGHEQGAAAMLVGDAANQSMETGAPISISDTCPPLGDARVLSELT
ncbi:MAG: Gfo/Idh/MocA family oxidoreductase [Gammaproteobacteria bacterium]|nr:Gfo/Idh/MocA family oxidoreductase [Gammaproteobacteria bacterium]